MKPITKMFVASALGLALAGGVAFAQEHHDDQEHHSQYVRHNDWKKGRHIRHEDWDHGQRVDDWQAHHLRRPPRGYQWREVDGQYVLANSDGIIFQVVIPH